MRIRFFFFFFFKQKTAYEITYGDWSSDVCSSDLARNRWGDYSFTDVDPNDDQTVWTFQEYALDATGTGFGGDWAIRAVQLQAPPPATPSGASPSSACQGLSSVNVTITGTSSSG